MGKVISLNSLQPLRDPKIRKILVVYFGLVAVLGVSVHWGTQTYLRNLDELARHSPDQVLQQAAWVMKGLAILLGGFCLSVAYFLFRPFRQAMTTRRLPQTGVWHFWGFQEMPAHRAVLMGKIGLALCGLLALCGVVAPFLMWWIVESLMARFS